MRDVAAPQRQMVCCTLLPRFSSRDRHATQTHLTNNARKQITSRQNTLAFAQGTQWIL